MGSKFVKIIDKKKWQDLLNKVLFKTFFHNLEWEEFLESQFKWLKFERYVYEGKVLLSMARVGDKLISHPFCEYGGPLLLTEKIDGKKFKADFLSEFKNHTKISFHPQLTHYFQNVTLAPSDRVSYFLKGSLNLRKTTRHQIEKAQTNHLQIEKCQDQKDLNDFYNLCLKSAKKHKIPAYPFSLFEYFLNSPCSEIILAKFNGKVIAGSVFLFYDKFIHYYQNAIDEKYKQLGGNYLILWNQIQNYNNLVFDLGGTRKGSLLEIFKKGWGGKEYPILELKNYKETSLKNSKLRNIFGLFPPFLIKKISPYLLRYRL